MTEPTDEQPTEQTDEHPLADNLLYQEVQRTIRANHRRQEELASQGANLNPDALLENRIELLIETLLPSDGMARLVFEARYVQFITSSLDEAEKALNQAKLRGYKPKAQPTGSGLILPGGGR